VEGVTCTWREGVIKARRRPPLPPLLSHSLCKTLPSLETQSWFSQKIHVIMIYSLAFSNRVTPNSISIEREKKKFKKKIPEKKKKRKVKRDGAVTCEETFHTSPCDAPPAYSPLPISRPRPQASLHNLNGPSLYAERTVGKIIYKNQHDLMRVIKSNQTRTQISHSNGTNRATSKCFSFGLSQSTLRGTLVGATEGDDNRARD